MLGLAADRTLLIVLLTLSSRTSYTANTLPPSWSSRFLEKAEEATEQQHVMLLLQPGTLKFTTYAWSRPCLPKIRVRVLSCVGRLQKPSDSHDIEEHESNNITTMPTGHAQTVDYTRKTSALTTAT